MHPKEYDRFVIMKDEEKSHLRERIEYKLIKSHEFDQNDFNRIIMNFMINGMQKPSLLMDPAFHALANGTHLFRSEM